MQNGAKSEPKPGRLRAAWYVLWGQRVTPQQIQSDWVEYQCIFNDLLERWSAKLARDAKAEKERIKRLDSAAPAATPVEVAPQISDVKQELRRKVASMRGFGLMEAPQLTLEENPNEPHS